MLSSMGFYSLENISKLILSVFLLSASHLLFAVEIHIKSEFPVGPDIVINSDHNGRVTSTFQPTGPSVEPTVFEIIPGTEINEFVMAYETETPRWFSDRGVSGFLISVHDVNNNRSPVDLNNPAPLSVARINEYRATSFTSHGGWDLFKYLNPSYWWSFFSSKSDTPCESSRSDQNRAGGDCSDNTQSLITAVAILTLQTSNAKPQ